MRYLAPFVALLLLLRSAPLAAAVVETDAITYHLLTPKDYDSKKTYRLVVAVHGRTGTGQFADGIAKAFWARGYDVIVVGPNMPWGSGPGKDKQADGHAAMAALLKDVRGKHTLQDKYVLTGFSQGGYFTCEYGPKHEDELLMAVYMGSTAPGNWLPKNLPIGGACGSMEAFGPGIKTWAEKTVAAGGYAVSHVAEGVGHTVTDSMLKMMVDLFEKCHKGLHPRVLEQVEAKFEDAKKLEESQKFKDAATKYKSVLATKSLPDDLKKQAKDGQLKAILSEMGKANPQITKTWDDSRKTVADALTTFPGLLEFRKVLDTQRVPFRGSELDAYFAQSETASQIISQISIYLKDLETATAKGGKGPSQKALNRKLLPLLEKIDIPEIKAALEPHLAKLPEPVS
jgi:pimeloyl-ACP methyl ester carboxylesterase